MIINLYDLYKAVKTKSEKQLSFDLDSLTHDAPSSKHVSEVKVGTFARTDPRTGRISRVQEHHRKQTVGREPAVKEPWQMTRNEHALQTLGSKSRPSEFVYPEDAVPLSSIRKPLDSFHERKVKQALADDKPVPAEVLKDYPELKKEIDEMVREIVKELKDKKSIKPKAIKPVGPSYHDRLYSYAMQLAAGDVDEMDLVEHYAQGSIEILEEFIYSRGGDPESARKGLSLWIR